MCRGRTRALPVILMIGLSAGAAWAIEPVPQPELSGFEEAVQKRLSAARDALLAGLENPEATRAEQSRLYGETGKVFHAHHAFEVAAACYRNAAELSPDDSLWPYVLGFLAQDSGDFASAAEYYRRVLALEPEHALATLRLGEVYLETGEVDQAEALLSAVVSEPGFGATAHAALAKIATLRQDHAAAVEHYTAALELEPEATRLHVPLGMAYRSLGEIDRAREHLDQRGDGKVRFEDPVMREVASLTVSSEVFITTATQALRAGQLERAERAYRGAIAANPENPRAHVNLAEVLARRGDLDAAEASAREALRLTPTSFFALFNLGNILEKRGDRAAAAEYFDRALVQDPKNVKANFRLASLLMRTGEYERAAELFRKVEQSAPSFVRARYLHALALVALSRPKEARSLLEEALAVDPQAEMLTSALARLLATEAEPSEDDAQRAL
jgi:protein O-GlcNAc transferase